MHLIRLPRAFEMVYGPRILTKNNGEKSVKSVKKYFYTVSATLNNGGKSVMQECNYKKKNGRV